MKQSKRPERRWWKHCARVWKCSHKSGNRRTCKAFLDRTHSFTTKSISPAHTWFWWEHVQISAAGDWSIHSRDSISANSSLHTFPYRRTYSTFSFSKSEWTPQPITKAEVPRKLKSLRYFMAIWWSRFICRWSHNTFFHHSWIYSNSSTCWFFPSHPERELLFF